MDDPSIGVFLAAGLLIFIVFVIVMAANSSRRQELRAFADQWQGQFHDAGFLPGTHVELDFGGVTARLDFTASDDEHQTHLTVPLRLPLGRLKLRPQRWGDEIGKFLGLEDIEIGVPDFDQAFIIQGSDPRQIRQILSEQVRAAITALRRRRSGIIDEVHLVVGSGMLRISLNGYLTTEKDLSQFATRCRALFDLLNPQTSHGIEFVDQPRATSAPEADCLICGSPLKDGIVHCAKCKTPHHRDCWQYFGSCSVYGCGQKRFVEFDRRS
jgi:hypothetical protein